MKDVKDFGSSRLAVISYDVRLGKDTPGGVTRPVSGENHQGKASACPRRNSKQAERYRARPSQFMDERNVPGLPVNLHPCSLIVVYERVTLSRFYSAN